MLTLDAGNKAALGRREIRIEPVLTVYDDAGAAVVVSPRLLPARPRRTLKPFTERSPVARLDFELAPDPAIRSLFVEEREVSYAEIVNGQTIQRFKGRIKQLERGWTVKAGAIVETVRVSALSPSQLLTEYEDEYATAYDGSGIASVYSLATICYTTSEEVWLTKGTGSTSQDAVPSWVNAVVDVPTSEVRWWTSGTTYSTAVHGVDYTVQVVSNALKVVWSGTANRPPDAAPYQLVVRVVKGFLFAKPHTTFAIAANFSGTQPSLSLGTQPIEAVADASGAAYERAWDALNNQSFAVALQFSTGVMTWVAGYTVNAWQLSSTTGAMKYVGTRGLIFRTSGTPASYEVRGIGIQGTYIDPSASTNDVATYLQRLYTRAGLSYGTLEASGVALNTHIVRDRGDRVLSAYMDNLAPNYLLLDGPEGPVQGKYVTQKTTPDFMLRTLTGLKTKEAPERATVVRVCGSKEVTERFDGNAKKGYAATNWDYLKRLGDGIDTTYATRSASAGVYPAELVIVNQDNRRIKQVKVKFQGRMRLYSSTWGGVADVYGYNGTPLPGNWVMEHETPQEVTLSGFDTMPMRETGGRNRLVLDFTPLTTPAVAVQVYDVTVVWEVWQAGEAWLTNDPALAANVGWINVGVSGSNDPSTIYVTPVRYWSPDVVKRWMIVPAVASGGGAPPLDSPYYCERWRHRIKEIVDPGYANTDPGKLKEIAQSYMDDLLRQAATQEAQVVLEPELEIGDTVAVYDASAGATSNRLVVGLEDGGSWTEPTTTIELADFD